MTAVMGSKERIARRVALELRSGTVVNLGVGLPSLVAQYLPAGIDVMFHGENGVIGITGDVPYAERDPMLLNASNRYVHLVPGASVVGSDMSFGIMRGGHLDLTVLGTLQVDEQGNIANWRVKDGPITGMGGAMDLAVGTRRLIVATEHCDRAGNPKIRTRCDYPLTAERVVKLIVTELAVIEVTTAGLVLRELSEIATLEEVILKTAAPLIVPETMAAMKTTDTAHLAQHTGPPVHASFRLGGPDRENDVAADGGVRGQPDPRIAPQLKATS